MIQLNSTETHGHGVNGHGVIVHGLHKTGTMFLYRFFKHLCRYQRIPLFSINNSPPNDSQLDRSTDSNFCLCPVRSYDFGSYQFDNLGAQTHIVQIRDPRDVLVSQYFSTGWIHTTATWGKENLSRRERVKTMPIDEYVKNEADISKHPLLTRYQPLVEARKDESRRIVPVFYEDMVLRFDRWVDNVLQAFGASASRWTRFRLITKFQREFRAKKETMTHNRRVIPGDHRDKLQPSTIEYLNGEYSEVLSALGYK